MCTCICTIILCRSMYHMLGWDILLQWLAKLRLQTKPLIEKLVAPMLACCCPSTSSTTKHNAAHPGLSKTCLLNPWHILTAPIDVLQKKRMSECGKKVLSCLQSRREATRHAGMVRLWSEWFPPHRLLRSSNVKANAKLFVALSQIAFLRLILSLLFGISCKPDTTCLNSQQCLPVVPKQQPVGKASRMWRDSEASVKLKTWARKQQKYVMHRRLI